MPLRSVRNQRVSLIIVASCRASCLCTYVVQHNAHEAILAKGENPQRSKRPRLTAKGQAPNVADKALKQPTNLTLDPEAITRGERFSRRHGVSLSQLVSRLLRALPGEDDAFDLAELTPVVRRLYGVAEGAAANREEYRKHLRQKFGGRK